MSTENQLELNQANSLINAEPIQDSKITDLEQYLKSIENKLESQLQKVKANLINLTNLDQPDLFEVKEENDASAEKNQDTTSLHEIVFEITKTLKSKFKHQHLYQFLPQIYFEQQLEAIKGTIVASLIDFKKAYKCNTPQNRKENSLSSKICSRGRFKLPRNAKRVLQNWYQTHMEDPYPSYEEKMMITKEANITMKQVNNCFINMRGRTCTKPYKPENFSSEIQRKLLVNPNNQ